MMRSPPGASCASRVSRPERWRSAGTVQAAVSRLALIQHLRDAGEELPACAWLVSPWTDLTISGSTLATNDAIDPIIHKAYLHELADAYLPAGMDRKDPRVSPLYADLSGLPPMLIQVGSAETLLDDAIRFAARAGAADVAVTLEDLAAHDSRVASLERAVGARPPRARRCRAVHPSPSRARRRTR